MAWRIIQTVDDLILWGVVSTLADHEADERFARGATCIRLYFGFQDAVARAMLPAGGSLRLSFDFRTQFNSAVI
jgi:hypothetical protein